MTAEIHDLVELRHRERIARGDYDLPAEDRSPSPRWLDPADDPAPGNLARRVLLVLLLAVLAVLAAIGAVATVRQLIALADASLRVLP
jgi:hypothetical protein